MTPERPRFDHLLALSDHIGTFEHADHAVARREHGYCTDDVARVLIAVAREPDPTRALLELGRTSFRFLTGAQAVNGEVRNRRAAGGRWKGGHGVADCWGRSVWAFGTAAARAPERWMRESARSYFDRGVEQRSPWRRAMAFAALGAAEVLTVDADDRRARAVLTDAVEAIGPLGPDAAWPWPEPRLAYANAALAEALIASGSLLGRADVVDRGLVMLGWLLDRETVDAHLSPTAAGGSAAADRVPAFDQQAIEVAAMADACSRAATVTGDGRWVAGLELAVRWFAGSNDAGVPMSDPATGGGFDGLHATAANQNQGAESTIALITTLQHARRLEPAAA